MLRNTHANYGLVAILIHWVSATVVIGLFCLGLWMVELDYYSDWYKLGPDIHRSIGMILFAVLIFRLVFRLCCLQPAPEATLKAWEHRAAVAVHWLLLLLIFFIILSGYLISTADGRAVDVFGWFEVPATVTFIEDQEDIAGVYHYYLALSLMIFSSFHAIAAFKHHFVDKDATLKKMLGINKG